MCITLWYVLQCTKECTIMLIYLWKYKTGCIFYIFRGKLKLWILLCGKDIWVAKDLHWYSVVDTGGSVLNIVTILVWKWKSLSCIQCYTIVVYQQYSQESYVNALVQYLCIVKVWNNSKQLDFLLPAPRSDYCSHFQITIYFVHVINCIVFQMHGTKCPGSKRILAIGQPYGCGYTAIHVVLV